MVAAALLSAAGCDENKPAVDDPQGNAECDELGELCHEAGEIDADAKECHEVGHTGDAAACAARFDECKTLCEAILAAAGAGGGGGAPSTNGGAAGAN